MEKVIANLEQLKSRASRKYVWLSDLKDSQDLMDILGGDVCIWGYTLKEWNQFSQWQTFNSKGEVIIDVDRVRWNQFILVIRDGPPPDGKPIFSWEDKEWVEQNLSPHLLIRLVQVSDELSGWKMNWDPFGNQKQEG